MHGVIPIPFVRGGLFGLAFVFCLCFPALAEENSTELRGQVVARNHAILSSQIGSLITTIRVREGEEFKAGDPLVDLDCRSYQALLAQAKASERLAQAILENTQSLAKMESASVQEVTKARCEVDVSTQAKVLSQLDVDRCTIRAPFAGTVLSLDVGKGEYVTTGKPLMEIVGTGDLEVHFLMPSTMTGSVRVGQPLEMQVYETGATIAGSIRQLAPVADPLNRTIKVFGVLTTVDQSVKPGMSGAIRLLP